MCKAYHAAMRPEIEAEARRNALGEGYGWQPIETAPKDGVLIILTTGTATGTGRWSVIASRDTLNDVDGVAVFAREYGWRSASDKALTGSQPTHWMPLPAPPHASDCATHNEPAMEAAVCGSDGKTVPIVEILADVAARADARLDRISDEIAACSGCGGREWPKDANCPACTDKVDEDIAREAAGAVDELPPLPPEAVAQMRAIAAEHDEAPLREAWKRGAEAMRYKIADSSYELRIALAHLLPPYQPKEPTP
jgi:hypothetical protein